MANGSENHCFRPPNGRRLRPAKRVRGLSRNGREGRGGAGQCVKVAFWLGLCFLLVQTLRDTSLSGGGDWQFVGFGHARIEADWQTGVPRCGIGKVE
jgi:hypothetical protein